MSTELMENQSEVVKPTREGRGPAEVFVRPAVNIRQDADGYTLEVELPGVRRDGVEITFEEGRLHLVGRRAGNAADGLRPIYRETGEASYRRVFDLDPSIDAGKIAASVDQGVLRIRLPKAETAKPRKITVS